MERESDPSAIAQVASSLPPFPAPDRDRWRRPAATRLPSSGTARARRFDARWLPKSRGHDHQCRRGHQRHRRRHAHGPRRGGPATIRASPAEGRDGSAGQLAERRGGAALGSALCGQRRRRLRHVRTAAEPEPMAASVPRCSARFARSGRWLEPTRTTPRADHAQRGGGSRSVPPAPPARRPSSSMNSPITPANGIAPSHRCIDQPEAACQRDAAK